MKIASKLSLLFGLLLLVASSASAQGGFASFISWRYTPAGAFPNGGATITICTSGATGAPCTPTVTVYQDSALTIPVANPLAQCTTSPQVGCIDNLGNVSFYASAGIYSYTITGAGLTPYGPIPVLAQPTSGSGGSGPTLEVNGTLTSSQILQNIVNSTADVVGLHCTANNPSGGIVKPCEITGSSYSGNAATATSATTATTAGSATTAGNLTGTPALPNGTSATTQTLGDNTAKLATDAFVLANISGGTAALSGITAATGSNLINSGNFEQIWNWSLTGNAPAFLINETTASTGGTGTSQRIMEVLTDAGSTAVPLTVGDALTGSQTLPAMYLPCSWNTTGVVDACLLMNVTNTASGSGSKLMDLQVGGSSQFSVDKGGNTLANGSMTAGGFIGNASTATALASTPTQCGGVQFAQGIAAGGNANCSTPTGLGIFNSANTFVLSPNCSVANTNNCFFIYADGRSVADAVTNGTMTVTSATAAFTAADTGKIGWVNCAGGANGVHDSTVTYVNSTTVTMSNSASGSSGSCIMVLGHNDATNVEAAWTALTSNLNCGHLWLPGGGIVTTEPFFQSPVIPARCQTSIGEDIGLTSIFGNSHVSTVIYPSPDDFDFTACVAGCFSPNGGSNEMRDIEVSGSGYTSVNLPGAASGKSVFVICKNGNGCWWRNITINNWASLQTTSFIGLVGLGQQSEIDFLDSDSACLFNSYNFTVSQGFCVGSGNNSSVTFGANCIPNCVSRNSTWSASNQLLPSVTVLNGGTYIGYGDNIENTATARAALSLGVGSVAITNDMSISGTGGVSAEAVLFNGAGSILKARNTTFSGGATIGSFSSGSAGWGEILDGGGNTCTNCFLTYSGTLVNAPSEPSLGGACLNASGAGPEACGASSHGTVAIPTTTTSYVIDTIAAYAGMRVQLNYKTSNSGIPSTPTCVVPSTLGDIYVSSITAGTSFTLTLPSTTGIVCVDWSIQ